MYAQYSCDFNILDVNTLTQGRVGAGVLLHEHTVTVNPSIFGQTLNPSVLGLNPSILGSSGSNSTSYRSIVTYHFRYINEFTCCDTDGTNGAVLKPWLLATMLDWHDRFPVSKLETYRNNVVYALQVYRPCCDCHGWQYSNFVRLL